MKAQAEQLDCRDAQLARVSAEAIAKDAKLKKMEAELEALRRSSAQTTTDRHFEVVPDKQSVIAVSSSQSVDLCSGTSTPDSHIAALVETLSGLSERDVAKAFAELGAVRR